MCRLRLAESPSSRQVFVEIEVEEGQNLSREGWPSNSPGQGDKYKGLEKEKDFKALCD